MKKYELLLLIVICIFIDTLNVKAASYENNNHDTLIISKSTGDLSVQYNLSPCIKCSVDSNIDVDNPPSEVCFNKNKYLIELPVNGICKNGDKYSKNTSTAGNLACVYKVPNSEDKIKINTYQAGNSTIITGTISGKTCEFDSDAETKIKKLTTCPGNDGSNSLYYSTDNGKCVISFTDGRKLEYVTGGDDSPVQSQETRQENAQLITRYYAYNSESAEQVHIYYYEDSDQLVVKIGTNISHASGETLNVNGLENYKSIFINKKAEEYPKYLIYNGTNYTFNNEKPDSTIKIYINERYLNGTGVGEEQTYKTCEDLFGSSFLNFLHQYVFKIIWIGVPILLILLTSLDFSKVVFLDDKDGIQNAVGRFKKRAIVSVLIFLTPSIIIILSNIIAPGDKTVSDCVKTIRNMSETAKSE